ncbi:unnamed protein product [Acanthoscelides obtectus]|uniref:Uncharacterized protein n=1 Tax=Acanthoscelides obtectus TaxID=200917 RepID=A0A9P0PJF3_ACAOB|nr:unnamed protein product [Acanthoscelides obtectus]CAK1681640.1 hypothetical protein AOBTE_LOCUS33183 [Acanthoscelides obtectus]
MPLRLWLHLNNSVVGSGNSNFEVSEDILRNVRHLEQDFDNSGNIEQDLCITYMREPLPELTTEPLLQGRAVLCRPAAHK